MTINDTLLDADLDDMFSDFNHSIVIASVTYAGLYEQAYVEVGDFSGYTPMFTGKTSDLSGAVIDTAVTVTSDLEGITNKAFTVKEAIPNGRVTQLVLHEV